MAHGARGDGAPCGRSIGFPSGPPFEPYLRGTPCPTLLREPLFHFASLAVWVLSSGDLRPTPDRDHHACDRRQARDAADRCGQGERSHCLRRAVRRSNSLAARCRAVRAAVVREHPEPTVDGGSQERLGRIQPDLIHIANEPWAFTTVRALRTGRPVVVHGGESLYQEAPLKYRLRRWNTSSRRQVAGYVNWGTTGMRAAEDAGLPRTRPGWGLPG